MTERREGAGFVASKFPAGQMCRFSDSSRGWEEREPRFFFSCSAGAQGFYSRTNVQRGSSATAAIQSDELARSDSPLTSVARAQITVRGSGSEVRKKADNRPFPFPFP